MPPVITVILVLFAALAVFVAIVKKNPIHLTPDQMRIGFYIMLGALIVGVVVRACAM